MTEIQTINIGELLEKEKRLDKVIANLETWLSMNEKLLEEVKKKGFA